ncbi:hypothetical protein MNB_SV-3-688 [hydrothermal vent metagenome]|uniref:HPt domain-containing protein n=1 Tax=hydrothermal vent metagenome TaxID=652676 RepID=A0A1W1C2N7_9ZZZZ
MGTLMKESLDIAAEKFKSFGFNEEQINQLLATGKRDLEQEIEKLKTLLAEDSFNHEKINQSLHAIKGLLYNLGNNEAGDIMAELKNNQDSSEQINKIKKTLNL